MGILPMKGCRVPASRAGRRPPAAVHGQDARATMEGRGSRRRGGPYTRGMVRLGFFVVIVSAVVSWAGFAGAAEPAPVPQWAEFPVSFDAAAPGRMAVEGLLDRP